MASLKKIIFLVPYPFNTAPGQRFRFEQYLEQLNQRETSFKILSFLSERGYHILYKSGNLINRVSTVCLGFVKRFFHLFEISTADYVFIYREAAPIGRPVLEWIIAKVLKRKIIYDFDDAIWLTDKTNESTFEKILRCRSKVASVCKWSYKVSCGNNYLALYASQFNSNVIINPTTVDTERVHNKILYKKNKPHNYTTIGWTGSYSTLKYLQFIEPVLHQLEKEFDFLRFLIIADQNPNLKLQRIEFRPWNKNSEGTDLLDMDIGIMPLPDDEWTKGKCGFKALQYMAMEIPCVASPIGVNTIIVEHGINGFLATTENDWTTYLSLLISDFELRKKMGQAGREKIIQHYSVRSNTNNFLSLFQ